MDTTIIIISALMLLLGFILGFMAALLWRGSGRSDSGGGMDEIKGQLINIAQTATTLQENVTTRLLDQERNLHDTLRKQAETTQQKLTDLQTRLTTIDKAQTSLKELSEQTTRLENVLSNKQARGAYGEMQLENLVKQILPPGAYEFQAKLSNNTRPDCLLHMPNPPGSIVIDAKFPLEAWYRLGDAPDDGAKAAARKELTEALNRHVDDIAGKYIIAGETAESALLFLPSEAIYAECHTNLNRAVERSFQKRVYLVSPTTLMATLNTVRAILRDVKMREQAAVIQAEVARLLEDIGRLNERVSSLDRHFGQAQRDIEQIKTTTGKISSRSDKIDQIDVEEDDETQEPPKEVPLS